MSTPLESTKYFILLALANEPQHGTAIRAQIIADTMGAYLHDGTLYSALKSMLGQGLIKEIGAGQDRRRTYALTERGRRRLELEARTHKQAAGLAAIRLGVRL